MNRDRKIAGIVAVSIASACAWAGPGEHGSDGRGPRQVTPPGGGAAGGGFAENFDSYETGSTIAGQGGWETWYSGGGNATVSDEQSVSGPHSLRDVTGRPRARHSVNGR